MQTVSLKSPTFLLLLLSLSTCVLAANELRPIESTVRRLPNDTFIGVVATGGLGLPSITRFATGLSAVDSSDYTLDSAFESETIEKGPGEPYRLSNLAIVGEHARTITIEDKTARLAHLKLHYATEREITVKRVPAGLPLKIADRLPDPWSLDAEYIKDDMLEVDFIEQRFEMHPEKLQLSRSFMNRLKLLPTVFMPFHLKQFTEYFKRFGTHYRSSTAMGRRARQRSTTIKFKDQRTRDDVPEIRTDGRGMRIAFDMVKQGLHPDWCDLGPPSALVVVGRNTTIAPLWYLVDKDIPSSYQYALKNEDVMTLWGGPLAISMRSKAMEEAYRFIMFKKEHDMQADRDLADMYDKAWDLHSQKFDSIENDDLWDAGIETYRGELNEAGRPNGTGEARFLPVECDEQEDCSLDVDGNRDAAGGEYRGEWKNGRFHGSGELTMADGSRIRGEFVAGVPHGIAYVQRSTYARGVATKYDSSVVEFRHGSRVGIAVYKRRGREQFDMLRHGDSALSGKTELWFDEVEWTGEKVLHIATIAKDGRVTQGLVVTPDQELLAYDEEKEDFIKKQDWSASQHVKWHKHAQLIRALTVSN